MIILVQKLKEQINSYTKSKVTKIVTKNSNKKMSTSSLDLFSLTKKSIKYAFVFWEHSSIKRRKFEGKNDLFQFPKNPGQDNVQAVNLREMKRSRD